MILIQSITQRCCERSRRRISGKPALGGNDHLDPVRAQVTIYRSRRFSSPSGGSAIPIAARTRTTSRGKNETGGYVRGNVRKMSFECSRQSNHLGKVDRDFPIYSRQSSLTIADKMPALSLKRQC